LISEGSLKVMRSASGQLMSGRDSESSWRTARCSALLVSNDQEVGGIWLFALRQMGLEATLVRSAAEAMDYCFRDAFDLVIIDVHGPDLDGIELTRELRAQAVNPILLFTPDRDEMHMLAAYQAGVDECVVKPVSPSLFVAKMRAWLRRSWSVPARALQKIPAGTLCLDPAKREVATESGSSVKLSNLEFRVLHLLMSHPGQVLPSDLIVDRVWGYPGGGDSVLLKNVVYRLRRKIEPDASEPRYLQTVAGEGYVFYST
jgi:two-component system response regulator RegX3